MRQDASHFDVPRDECSIVGKAGASLSRVPANNEEFSQGAPKEQGSFGPRNESSVPSRNTVSKEYQAGLRVNLGPVISSPATAQKISNDILTFSAKNTSK